jgi:hypothetical protein
MTLSWASVSGNQPKYYIPITLTNNQNTQVASGTQIQLSINSNTNSSYYQSALLNVNFQDGSGNILYSWLESGETNISIASIYWMVINSSIGASGGTLTIYQCIYNTSVIAMDGNYTGSEPNYTGTYGQYDNGANVFTLYDNFKSFNSSIWTTTGSISYTMNNGLTVSGSSSGWGALLTNSTFGTGTIFEFNGKMQAPSSNWYMVGYLDTSSYNRGSFIITYSSTIVGQQQNSSGGSATSTYGSPPITAIWSVIIYSSSVSHYEENYGSDNDVTSDAPSYPLPVGFEPSYCGTGLSETYTWARIRTMPPNNTLPSESNGTITGTPTTMSKTDNLTSILKKLRITSTDNLSSILKKQVTSTYNADVKFHLQSLVQYNLDVNLFWYRNLYSLDLHLRNKNAIFSYGVDILTKHPIQSKTSNLDIIFGPHRRSEPIQLTSLISKRTPITNPINTLLEKLKITETYNLDSNWIPFATQTTISNSGGTLTFRPIEWNEGQDCNPSTRYVPLKQLGEFIDSGTYLIKTRSIDFTIRLSDSEKTILDSIFNSSQMVNLYLTNISADIENWVYYAWIKDKSYDFEWRVEDNNIVRWWRVKLSLDVKQYTYTGGQITPNSTYASGTIPTGQQITNGNFATGDLTGWTIAHDSPYVGSLCSGYYLDLPSLGQVYQNINNVPVNTLVSFGFYYQGSSVDGAMQVIVDFSDGTYYANASLPNEGSYTYFDLMSALNNSGFGSKTITRIFFSGNNYSDAYVQNVSLIASNYPSNPWLGGVELNFVLNYSKKFRKEEQLPEWINYPAEVLSNIWNEKAIEIEFNCRMTDIEKLTFDKMLENAQFVYLIDPINNIQGWVWIKKINDEWQPKKGLATGKQWRLDITVIGTNFSAVHT